VEFEIVRAIEGLKNDEKIFGRADFAHVLQTQKLASLAATLEDICGR